MSRRWPGRLRWDRARRAVGGGMYYLVQPIHNALLALVVARILGPSVWGAFVVNLLAVQLGALLADWGSREWLMREVSLGPSRLGMLWQTSLMSRLPLLLLLPVALLVLGWDPPRVGLCSAWALALTLARSFDVLVVYRGRFTAACALELAAVAAIVALVWSSLVTSVDGLIVAAILVASARVAVYAVLFASDVLMQLAGALRPSVLLESKSFFLMGFSGWLSSRIDVYVVAAVLAEEDLARYQILMGFLVMAQAVAGWSLQPFVKGLYRLAAGPRSALMPMALLGLLVTALSVPTIFFVLARVYGTPVGALAWVPAAVLVVVPFLYLPSVYDILRAGRASLIVWLNLSAAVASAGLCLVFAPRFGVHGALSSTAVVAGALTVFHVVRLARLRESRGLEEGVKR